MSGILLLVRRSLRQHALSTCITVGSVALACGLVMAVFSIKTQTHEAFTGGNIGYDAVLGARGSQLQLVLNTVFHLETSPGNIPWKMYQEIKKNPQVELAIPYALGDNYEGFRIVGTSDELFTKFEYQEGKKFLLKPGGVFFDPTLAEAIVGSYVAEKTGLKVNDTFNPFHGLDYDPTLRHNEVYHVVGVLEPTNTPNDRVIWIPIDGLFRMGGHTLRGTGKDYKAEAGKPIPDEAKEVSAVMLKLKSEFAGMALEQQINKQGKAATLAWPIGKVMLELFEKIGWVDRVLALVAYLVVAVAAGSILASIYNTMNERRREFAILRALGARKGTVFSAIVTEASAIALLGSLLGFGVYAVIIEGAAVVIRQQTGVVIDILRSGQLEIGSASLPVVVVAPIAMVLIGALAGVVPAIKAYSTDVASNLTPTS
ncbi:MAG: ABC transporter permease [Planctomycetes bacterium]|nr:ABC transporter permease [Planctomycetota bacterium]